MKFFRIVLVFLCVAMFSCKDNTIQQEEKKKYIIPDSLLHTLQISRVEKCPLINAIRLTGMIDFNQDKQVTIYSMVSGIIQDIKVQIGDRVTAGQILAVVKSSEMAGYSNNLIVAQTTVGDSRTTWSHQRTL